ncbi:ABC transporter substrate-binding protein [Bradyrhizobium jicamae]|uniref:ABC transporter substrate-binding protein n=1 Tax=Bradyrhizobium jicamae TaxID=280332 RepID=A0ABS5FDW1_9BRAD|nr:ABC transporter substrate-binding protein [Bradyrhizobium jicamae]MBR0794970.1 ABC transporter substrate-binding protein [Bradyrhizobium jicamae]
MKRRQLIVAFASVATWPFARPLAAFAQGSTLYRIGFLSQGSFAPDTYPGKLTGLITQHLARSGFTPASGCELVERGAEGHLDRLPGLVTELLAAKVDVIVAFGYFVAAAVKQGTGAIPTVIFATGDPVKTQLVASLNRPEGNITGISDVAGELAPKRLELLKQTAPRLQRLALLWNAGNPGMTERYEASAAAAKTLNVTVVALGVREPNDFEDAFAAMQRSMPDGLLIVADALTALNRKRIFDFAATHRLPTIYETDDFVRAGGLMSYGPDQAETAERGASLVARILKGEKPANLPLEQPTRFRLVVNLKTAQSLGLAIPPSILLLADELIE